MRKTGGGVREGEERLQCFTSLRLRLVSFSPVFTGTERIADTGLTFFCYCTVKECKVPEQNNSSDHAACVLLKGSHVGHLAKISFRSFQLKQFLQNSEENMNSIAPELISELLYLCVSASITDSLFLQTRSLFAMNNTVKNIHFICFTRNKNSNGANSFYEERYFLCTFYFLPY